MSDGSKAVNVTTPGFVDGSGNYQTTSTTTPFPVTLTTGGTDQDVNLVAVAGEAVTAGAGAVAAGTPRVTLASNDPAVVALQIIDDWDESDRAKVNPIVGQAGVAAGSGAVGVTVQRTTLATDQAAMTTVAALKAELGPYSFGRVTADGQIKATAGFIHSATISPTGTVTAGVLTIYDSAAESGTVLAVFALPITTFTAFSVVFDATMATGIYVGFDATLANVSCTVTYR
jgi:hypothetical protein